MNELEELKTKFKQNSNEVLSFFENLKLKCDDEQKQKSFQKGVDTLKILMPLELDTGIVFATLMLDLLRNNLINSADFLHYADSVNLAQSVIKIEGFNFVNKHEEAENLRSMLVAVAKDIRVVLIKLADILNDVRHIKELLPDNAKNLHIEIMDIYIPLAARLGLSYIKSELQDLDLMYTKPNEYKKLLRELAKDQQEREQQIESVKNQLKELLFNLKIDGEVKGRLKHISSIYNKISTKNYSLNQIYDLTAVRVIVKTIDECYMVLGMVHSKFIPIDGRFKDYIARPKANGYQSIHTTVLINESPIEIQIRTVEMHNHAEYGIAAHWLYKEHKQKISTLDERLVWIRKMIENPETTTSEEFIEQLKTDVYSGEIFVQTPKGKILQLPENSTPIDFAYSIHSDVGNKCVGARVNSKMVPLTTFLNNGDTVEIITNANAKGPSRDWLKFAQTSIAKSKINAFFKHEMKDENIKRGKSMLEQASKIKGFDIHILTKDEWLQEVLDKYSFNEPDEMFAAIGYGSLNTTQVLNKLIGLYKQSEEKERIKIIKPISNTVVNNQSNIKELSNMMIKYAHCCNPVPGDKIVGFISRGRGVTIHRADCISLKNMEKERLMEISWGDDLTGSYVGGITILVKNAQGVLAEISNKIAESKININSITTENNKTNKEQVLIDIKVTVSSKAELNDLMNKISPMPNVIKVFRGAEE